MSTLLHRAAPLILAVLAVALPGCGGILSSPEQRQLYQVKAPPPAPAGLPRRDVQLTIATVDSPAGLDTERIALSRSAVSLDYFAGVAWSDRAPAMVRTVMVQAFENSAAFAAVGTDSFNLRADYILKPEMRDFEAVYDSASGAPQVTIALSLKLLKATGGTVAAQTVVTVREPAPANDVPTIVATFNTALGKALNQAIAWAAANAALPAARR